MNISEISQASKVYEKFLRRLTVLPNGCWSLGTVGKYSRFRTTTSAKDLPVGGHRYSYEVHTGKLIPQGMQIDHLCREKSCCNPEHLEVVTPRENSLRNGLVERVKNRDPEISRKFREAGRRASREKAARRTHCNRGHLYAGDSYINKKGARVCLACSRLGHYRRRQLAR